MLQFDFEEVIQNFDNLETIPILQRLFFTSTKLIFEMENSGNQWGIVITYGPMSNRIVERVVSTIKHAITKSETGNVQEWTINLLKILFGYRPRKTGTMRSIFEFLFENSSRGWGLCAFIDVSSSRQECGADLSTKLGGCCGCSITEAEERGLNKSVSVEDRVLVVQSSSVQKNVKWLNFTSKYTTLYTVAVAIHPRYELLFSIWKIIS